MEQVCKRCYRFQEEGEKLQETINHYIEALEAHHKVAESVYTERLVKCETCDALVNGVCKYCGCFVVVRAIKTKQRCPYPNQRKW
ncbi:MAG: DUF6171 family protein [Cellulosilyticaceae bacterium]